MNKLYGSKKKRACFEGWYFKQTGQDGTIAFIPAFHVGKDGRKWASLQLITDKSAFYTEFPPEQLHVTHDPLSIQLADCSFSESGCEIVLQTPELSVRGMLTYKTMQKPMYDIMGPFVLVPFMECRHQVVSMLHSVHGQVEINGQACLFSKGRGYIEGDRGRSFPKQYCWTQCYWKDGSIMLSIGEIPFAGTWFWGCIGFVYLDGVEYRLATYLGVKLLTLSKEKILVKQGDLELEVRLLEENPSPLRAPKMGEMSRTIHESVACTVSYQLRWKGETVLEHISCNAGYEWDMA